MVAFRALYRALPQNPLDLPMWVMSSEDYCPSAFQESFKACRSDAKRDLRSVAEVQNLQRANIRTI